MTQWPQYEMVSNPRGRILAMDSAGYVDERNDVSDVLICGSHGAPCATQLVMWARPRGLFIHDAGIGLGDGGVNGLKLLDTYLISVCRRVVGHCQRGLGIERRSTLGPAPHNPLGIRKWGYKIQATGFGHLGLPQGHR